MKLPSRSGNPERSALRPGIATVALWAALALPSRSPAAAYHDSGLAIAWSPLFDQAAQAHLESRNRTLLGNPEFVPGQTGPQTWDKIHRAIAAAHQKGVRALDIQFIVTPRLLQGDYAAPSRHRPFPPVSDETLPGLAQSNQDWLEAVETFNGSRPDADPIRLRLRINATAANLYYIFRTLKPYRTFLEKESFRDGVTRSRFTDLPFDPCFEKPLPDDPCFRESPVPATYYRTVQENGRLNNAVANLANPAIRKAIVAWTHLMIREASVAAPNTVIEEVSLSLDAGSESSLFPSDTGRVISFSDTGYSPSASLAAKWALFRARESVLKDVYVSFAEAVHAHKNRMGATIKAGVFQQAWAMDGRARGTFDLYSLLKGTGIDVLHHTQMPLDSARSMMAVAFSAGIAHALGIGFDTEFSWAHYGDYGGNRPLYWERRNLKSANAEMFLGQAVAAMRYGAAGFTYANWTMREFLAPPPGRAWERIFQGRDRIRGGTDFPALRKKAVDSHSSQGPMRALYLGSFGRMACEEKAAHATLPGAPCDLGSYFDWFEKSGLWSGKTGGFPWPGKMIVLTDGMIRDGKPGVDSISEILMPFETSSAIDSAAYQVIRRIPKDVQKKFRWQTAKGANAFAGLADWERKVEVFSPGRLRQ